MMFDDLSSVKNPKITVITASLNHSRFLRDTIDSICQQSYRNFEHIIIDGGSTDDTIDILKTYPHIKWVSEKDTGLLEAHRKGFSMSKGEYIVQCCVTDGFLDKNWFKKCIEILDSDIEVSLVWGLTQCMTENGDLSRVFFPHFFADPPPNKMDFLPYWLATGYLFREANYCVRRKVFDICLPKYGEEGPFNNHHALGFIYNFNTLGYLAYFLPVVASFVRLHKVQRSQWRSPIENPIYKKYYEYLRRYRKKLFKGQIKHCLRDGASNILKEVNPIDLKIYKRKMWRYRINNSRFMHIDLCKIMKKLLFFLI